MFFLKKKGHKATQAAALSFWNIATTCETCGEPIYRAMFRILHDDGVTSFFAVENLGSTYQLVFNFRGTYIVLASGSEDVMLQGFHAIVDDICSSSANHRSPLPASDAKPFSSSRFGIFRFSGRQKLGILLIAVVSALMGYPIIAARAAPTRPPAEP